MTHLTGRIEVEYGRTLLPPDSILTALLGSVSSSPLSPFKSLLVQKISPDASHI